MSYRKDFRSDEEFRRDIKAGALAEKQILERWLNVVEKETGTRPAFTDNGCDNSGEYLEERDVTLDADYSVEGYGLIEVKFANPKLHTTFHLKVDQVDRILQDESKILFANGWATKNETMFALITPDELGAAILRSRQVPWHGFGGKMAYRLKVNHFHWQRLP